MTTFLLGLNTAELRALAQKEGQPTYRGGQLAEWIYRRGARSFDEMTDLPADLRRRLEERYRVGRSTVAAARRSRDGAVKLLLTLQDGACVEAVGLPYAGRLSCCVSTMVGCPAHCVFCASGLSGHLRNLSAGEIVDQVLAVQEDADASAHPGTEPRRVDHVTFMGMGEPLLNYEDTVKALHLLAEEMGLSMRHLTISTAGHVPGMLKLAGEKLQLTLAVSLHAATDELRRELMPGMSRWSIAEIIEACRQYVKQTGRRVTFEYCLLQGINESISQAKTLARLIRGLNCHVNLIPYNPVPGVPFQSPAAERVTAFRQVLEKSGIQVTQRLRRGKDIDAACGQLRRRMAGQGSR